jgi:hypothetical protein
MRIFAANARTILRIFGGEYVFFPRMVTIILPDEYFCVFL